MDQLVDRLIIIESAALGDCFCLQRMWDALLNWDLIKWITMNGRSGTIINQTTSTIQFVSHFWDIIRCESVRACVCVCVCVWERERGVEEWEREGEKGMTFWDWIIGVRPPLQGTNILAQGPAFSSRRSLFVGGPRHPDGHGHGQIWPAEGSSRLPISLQSPWQLWTPAGIFRPQVM